MITSDGVVFCTFRCKVFLFTAALQCCSWNSLQNLAFRGIPQQPFESRNHKLRDIHPDTSAEIFWLQAAGWSLSAWVFVIDNNTGACCDQEPGVCNWPNLRCATVATSIGRKSQNTLQTEYKHNLSVSPDRDDFSVLVANLKKRKAGACAESCSGFARTLDAKEKAKDKHHDIMSLPRILRPSPFCKVVKKGTYQISSNIFKHPNIIQPAVNSLSRGKFVCSAWVPQPLCHMFRVLQLHGLQGGQAPLPKLHDLSNCRPSHVVPGCSAQMASKGPMVPVGDHHVVSIFLCPIENQVSARLYRALLAATSPGADWTTLYNFPCSPGTERWKEAMWIILEILENGVYGVPHSKDWFWMFLALSVDSLPISVQKDVLWKRLQYQPLALVQLWCLGKRMDGRPLWPAPV